MSGGINGIALGSIGAGGLFLYAAIANKSVVKTMEALVSGKSPSLVLANASVVTSVSDSSSGNSSSDLVPSDSSTGADSVGSSAAVMSFLKGKTHNKAMIAGIMGNIQIESSFNSGVINEGEGAIGYCQWELGRRTKLQQFAAGQGKSESDSTTQLQFMWHELITSFPLVYASMQVQTSPENAAAIWDAQYEESAGTSRGERESAARAWYGKL